MRFHQKKKIDWVSLLFQIFQSLDSSVEGNCKKCPCCGAKN